MASGSDYYSGSALAGAGGGAASGAMIGSAAGPYGAAIGGLIGGGIGLFSGASANSQRNDAVNNQSKSIDQVMKNMQKLSAQNYSNYLAGLKKAQAFYGPAMESWNHFYGPGTATGNFQVPAQETAGK
jgi:phage tail tape-measure protein